MDLLHEIGLKQRSVLKDSVSFETKERVGNAFSALDRIMCNL